MLVVMFLYMMTSVIDLNTLNLNPKLFGLIWIRNLKLFFINLEKMLTLFQRKIIRE